MKKNSRMRSHGGEFGKTPKNLNECCLLWSTIPPKLNKTRGNTTNRGGVLSTRDASRISSPFPRSEGKDPSQRNRRQGALEIYIKFSPPILSLSHPREKVLPPSLDTTKRSLGGRLPHGRYRVAMVRKSDGPLSANYEIDEDVVESGPSELCIALRRGSGHRPVRCNGRMAMARAWARSSKSSVQRTHL